MSFLYIFHRVGKNYIKLISGGYIMNTHTNKKVVCVKDIPSNLIEEAIFILKSDVVDDKNSKTKGARREIILKETEDLVREYSDEFDRMEIEEENEKVITNEFKLKIVLSAVLVVLVCYLISIII